MRKLPRKPLADSAYQAILREILDGSLKPGERLREESLCERLGVSRTPLREALLRLSKEGLVERSPNRGCAVRKRSPREVSELMELRADLECLALKKWGSSLDAGKAELIRAKLSALKGAPDSQKLRRIVLESDEELHGMVLEACGNAFLKEQIARFQELCRPYRIFRCESSRDLEGIIAERLRVADAFLERHPAKAVQALKEHFAQSAAAFAKALES